MIRRFPGSLVSSIGVLAFVIGILSLAPVVPAAGQTSPAPERISRPPGIENQDRESVDSVPHTRWPSRPAGDLVERHRYTPGTPRRAGGKAGPDRAGSGRL